MISTNKTNQKHTKGQDAEHAARAAAPSVLHRGAGDQRGGATGLWWPTCSLIARTSVSNGPCGSSRSRSREMLLLRDEGLGGRPGKTYADKVTEEDGMGQADRRGV
jgi:hypothetical protein